MYYTFSKTQGEDFLFVELHNIVLHKALAEQLWTDLYNVSIKIECMKCVLEMKDSIFGEKIEGIFKLANYFDSIGFSKNYNFAVISKLMTESLSIFDILLKKKGYNFRIFRNQKEAIEWVTSDGICEKHEFMEV